MTRTSHRTTLLFMALFGIAAGAIILIPAAARAQGTELGMDASVQTTFGSGTSITTVAIPQAAFRAGFFIAPLLSLEPRVGLIAISGGGSTGTIYSGSLGLLLHLPSARAGMGPYIRPFAGISGTSGSGSTSQAGAGVGLGVKLPMSDVLAARLEANYEHAFSSSSFDSANALGASAGLSYFIR